MILANWLKSILTYLFILLNLGLSYAQKDIVYNDIREGLKAPAQVYKLYINASYFDEEEWALLDSLEKFRNLEELTMSNWGSGPKTFPMSILKLSKLKRLIFYEYKLKTVPAEIIQLTKLEELSLIRNQLETFPVAITKLKNLKVLKLKGNYFVNIPFSIGKLKTLKELAINEGVSSLPASFSRLNKLESLDLESNRFDTLPVCIQKLKNLKELDLGHCSIKTILEGFGNNLLLTHLSLRYNKIQKFPSSFSSLSKLEKLDLSNNALKAVPSTFSELKALIHLDLSFNNFEKFPSEIITLPSLLQLNLLQNKIKHLPEQVEQLKSIQDLNLSLNDLACLPKSIGELSNLEVLDCSFCYLKEIPKSILQLKKIKKIDFKYNEIERRPLFLMDLKKARKVNLIGNKYVKDREDKEAEIIASVQDLIDVRDSTLYSTVQINQQVWLRENLKFKTPASEIDTLYPKKVGRVYSLEESLIACPDGWHSATETDWKVLFKEALFEFPQDPKRSLHLKMKEGRKWEYYDEPTVMFNSDFNRAYYPIAYYLGRERFKRAYMNFYKLNIKISRKGESSYVAMDKEDDSAYKVYFFLGKSVGEIKREIKLKQKKYSVRCVKN
jgi:uncharacterized protein (TIGR02145 family)